MHALTLRACAALAGLAALAGCGQPLGTFDRAEFVQQSAARALHEIAFIPGTDRMEPGEAERLRAFLGAMAMANAEDLLLTFVPSGSPDLDGRRVLAASDAVRAPGLPVRLHIVDSRTADRLDRRSEIVLVEALGRGQILVACPRRFGDAIEERYATPIPRMGCANAANLAHMAARPSDLVAPRTLGRAGGPESAAAVLRHRNGEVTPPPPVWTTDR